MNHNYALIMAGGGGTRLWPLSRSKTPKQLLPLVEDISMFRVSVERLAPLFEPSNIYVVTGRDYVEALRQEAPDLPEGNFIVEPAACDSGPAAALGMTVIRQRDPQAVVSILTADHHIADKEGFRNLLDHAHKIAAKRKGIVTLGISPTSPATAFGYIRQGDLIQTEDNHALYHSRGFTEKPNSEKAIEFLLSGEYCWNSGMFIWSAEKALEELCKQQPKMYDLMQRLAPTVDTPQYQETLDQVWGDMPKISLDYAIMEKASDMMVIPISIGWSDVGSWGSLFEVLPLDETGNGFRTKQEAPYLHDTHNTLISSSRFVAAIGIKDIIVIDGEDALLICHKDRSQDVKSIVAYLKDNSKFHYL
jgi:mannose-1-phosphate guanylyltransferase